jgi:catechol 2,3-dioxygenase-like lactoylglutathione lyase family enzyme
MSTTRIQLALNVEDIAEATAFYERLFGVPPHKQRDGYANFVVEDPPLKLVLFQSPGAGERLNHLGIEAPTVQHVSEALARFQAAELQTRFAERDVCCHAVQDKVFVTAPDVPLGWWEYYTVTDDNPAEPDGATTLACGPGYAGVTPPRSPAVPEGPAAQPGGPDQQPESGPLPGPAAGDTPQPVRSQRRTDRGSAAAAAPVAVR